MAALDSRSTFARALIPDLTVAATMCGWYFVGDAAPKRQYFHVMLATGLSNAGPVKAVARV